MVDLLKKYFTCYLIIFLIALAGCGKSGPSDGGDEDGGLFKVDWATAFSDTEVEVCFNDTYNNTRALETTNYEIMDADEATLGVSSVEASSDPDCVVLTTDSQVAGDDYEVDVTNVINQDGDSLDISDRSLIGFLGDETGGDLNCVAGDQPASITVPKGAQGVPFLVVECSNTGGPVVISSMTFHRFGAGDEDDFADVYLYANDFRITTGRSINSETQNVVFNGLNYEIASTHTFTVVGDISLTADAAAQHGFELEGANKIESNAASISGDFPIAGNLMTISGATAGSATISQNSSLDDITIGESDSRIAQLEIEAGSVEGMDLERIALYIRGTCDSENITELKLQAEGEGEVLAEVDSVSDLDFVTFVLDNPFSFDQGDSQVFFATAKPLCDNNETIRTFLDQPTDLHMVGTTFGIGVNVENLYDGVTVGGVERFSEVTVKGSDFTVAFNGPSAGEVAVGQDEVSCLDLTLTNNSGQSLEIRDWEIEIEVTTGDSDGDAGDLLDDDGFGGITANYTLIKLARVNDDSSIGGALLGPSELDTGGSDVSQTVVLNGTNNIAAGESINAALVFDIASNDELNGDVIRCTLIDLTTVPDAVRDINGDQLGAESITPATDIVGNLFTVTVE